MKRHKKKKMSPKVKSYLEALKFARRTHGSEWNKKKHDAIKRLHGI